MLILLQRLLFLLNAQIFLPIIHKAVVGGNVLQFLLTLTLLLNGVVQHDCFLSFCIYFRVVQSCEVASVGSICLIVKSCGYCLERDFTELGLIAGK